MSVLYVTPGATESEQVHAGNPQAHHRLVFRGTRLLGCGNARWTAYLPLLGAVKPACVDDLGLLVTLYW